MDASVFNFAKRLIRDGQGTIHGFTRYRVNDAADDAFDNHEDITWCNRTLGKKWTMVHISERINCIECLGSDEAEG